MTTAKLTVSIGAHIPPALSRRLEITRKATGLSRGKLIEQALDKFLPQVDGGKK